MIVLTATGTPRPSPSVPISLRALGRATLARQLLLERSSLGVVDVVSLVGGLQAQEAKPPHLGLWNRVIDFSRADLNAAMHDRSLVRGTLMRGTLHTVGAVHFPALRTAVAPMLAQASATIGPLPVGLLPSQVADVARELLTDNPMTFNALRPLLLERFPGANDRALGLAVRMHLPLVMIPTDDLWGFPGNAKFGLADSWLSGPPVLLSEDQARESVVRQHLRAFGPASAADITAWSGMRGAARVIAALGDRLEILDCEGRQLYDVPDGLRPDEDTPAPPRLLGEWDSVMLGHAEHSRVVDASVRARLMTSNGRLRNAFMVDGRVVGSWRAERNKTRATLTLEPYVRVPRAGLASASREASRLLDWLEPDATGRDVRVIPFAG